MIFIKINSLDHEGRELIINLNTVDDFCQDPKKEGVTVLTRSDGNQIKIDKPMAFIEKRLTEAVGQYHVVKPIVSVINLTY